MKSRVTCAFDTSLPDYHDDSDCRDGDHYEDELSSLINVVMMMVVVMVVMLPRSFLIQ